MIKPHHHHRHCPKRLVSQPTPPRLQHVAIQIMLHQPHPSPQLEIQKKRKRSKNKYINRRTNNPKQHHHPTTNHNNDNDDAFNEDDEDDKYIIDTKSPFSKLITNFKVLKSKHDDFAHELHLLQQRQQHKTQQLLLLQQQSQSQPDNKLKLEEKYSSNQEEEEVTKEKECNYISNVSSSSFSSNVDYNFNLALTRAILQCSFGLTLPCMTSSTPTLSIKNHKREEQQKFLCPPVPNRANYVAWIQSLVKQSCSSHYFVLPTPRLQGEEVCKLGQMYKETNHVDFSGRCSTEEKDERELTMTTPSFQHCYSNLLHYQGIDIGTGASCIYPLLLSTSIFMEDEYEKVPHIRSNEQTVDKRNTDDKFHYPTWRFAATDIDPESILCAKENVIANNLQDMIHALLVGPSKTQRDFGVYGNVSNNDVMENSVASCKDDDSDGEGEKEEMPFHCDCGGPVYAAIKAAEKLDIFQRKWGYPIGSGGGDVSSLVDKSNSSSASSRANSKTSSFSYYDFVMTNPPFYASQADATTPRQGDNRPRTDMTKSESVYPGGELGFVLDMMKDSVLFKDHVTWYTSMIGKKSTLTQLIRILRDAGFGTGSVRTTEFLQGNQLRWGIAWTFRDVSARSLATKVKGGLQQFEVSFTPAEGKDEGKLVSKPNPVDEVVDRIRSFCESFKDVSLRCIEQTPPKSLGRDGDKRIENNIKPLNDQTVTILQSNYDPDDKNVNSKSKHDACSISNPFPSGPANFPKEGHFLIDVYVKTGNVVSLRGGMADDHGDGNTTKQTSKVVVKLKSYSHSLMGLQIINKIHDTMKGEVGRTNRRWRRAMARQNQE
mmetsp:Transcript_12866/g.18792  ORF Transcript_12866/g.18792 Transcript_12866/m.18792 type:complete len:828 (-) Transcript_12866:64-2547(-)